MNLFDAYHSHLMLGKKIRAYHWNKESFLQEKKIETYFCGEIGFHDCTVDQDNRFVAHFFKELPFEWRMYEWEVVE